MSEYEKIADWLNQSRETRKAIYVLPHAPRPFLPSSPATHLQLHGILTPRMPVAAFVDHVHIFLHSTGGRRTPRQRRRDRHREWQRRDRATRSVKSDRLGKA